MSGANQIIRIAALKSGKAANATGQKGKFEEQINGVSPDVLVSATGGTDAETDDEYRSRALAIIQKRSSSYGKRGDYAAWAISADREIVKAWEVPNIENGGALGILIAGSDLATVSSGALQNAKTQVEQNKLAGVDTTIIRAKVKTLDFRLKIVPDSAALRVATKNALETQIVQNQKPAAQIALINLKNALEGGVSGLSSLAILSPVSRYCEYAARNLEAGGSFVELGKVQKLLGSHSAARNIALRCSPCCPMAACGTPSATTQKASCTGFAAFGLRNTLCSKQTLYSLAQPKPTRLVPQTSNLGSKRPQPVRSNTAS